MKMIGWIEMLLLVVTALSVVGAFFVYRFMKRLLIHPLYEMTDTINEIRQGNWDAKISYIVFALLSIGRIFYSDFGLFYQVPMNSGMLANVTQTINVYVYKGLTQLNDVGRSSAAGFYQSFVGFVLVLTANFTIRKVDKESALF